MYLLKHFSRGQVRHKVNFYVLIAKIRYLLTQTIHNNLNVTVIQILKGIAEVT